MDLALSEGAAFTLDYHVTSGEISSVLPYRTEDGQDLFGEGMSQYSLSTMPGQGWDTVIE